MNPDGEAIPPRLSRVLAGVMLVCVALAGSLGGERAGAAESLIVTTLVDENNGTSDPTVGTGTSLREAIIRANTDGVNSAITFDPVVFAAPRKTITLNGTQLPNLVSNGSLSITAPAAGVEISANHQSMVFFVNFGANVTLTGLTIRDGDTFGTGGGIRNNGATLLVDSCTFTGNRAENGGAIYSGTSSGRTTTIRNSTLSGNAANSIGGALYNEVGLTIIESSTITGNTAPAGQGSGVASYGDTSVMTTVQNSIIAGNTNTDVDFIEGLDHPFQSIGHNLIGDGNAAGDFNQAGDQVIGDGSTGLGPLQDNGGRTQTRAVSPSSPAYNTGDTTLTVDQRGVPRPQAGSDDKGAFESTYPSSLVVTTTADEDDGTSNPAVGTGTSLREAINLANSDSVNSAITFDPVVFAGPRKTITLNGTQLPTLVGNGTLSITAPAAGVQISGNNLSRIFQVSATANVSISGLTIVNGSTAAGGGAIFNEGTLLLDSCTLTGNNAHSASGGAIFSQTDLTGRTLTLRNCTLSGNVADSTGVGGALFNFTGLTVLDSCTIAGNFASAGGGVASRGLQSEDENSVRTEVRNSIISANVIGDVGTVLGLFPSFQSHGYNLIGTGNGDGADATLVFNQTGDEINNTDPKLNPLTENAGRTPTMSITVTSHAYNTGNTTLLVDQRGVPRPFGAAADKGALELAGSLVVTTTVDEDDHISIPGYGTGTSLREAIDFANNDGVDSVITFDPVVFAAPRKTITLSGTHLPTLNRDSQDYNAVLSIIAPAAGVEISGNHQSRVFTVANLAHITLTGLTIRDGNASTDPDSLFVGAGGGIYNDRASPLIVDSCTLTGNTATSGGAIFSTTAGFPGDPLHILIIRNSTLSGNSATNAGGGLRNISGNLSSNVIESSTITGNTAPTGQGSGVAASGVSQDNSRLEVRNSIIAGNSNTDVDFVQANHDPIQSDGHNLIGGGNATSNFNQTADQVIGNASPGLGPLQDNGGPTWTLALLPGSPALDSGASGGLAKDQRGAARAVLTTTNTPSGDGSDIGAFEAGGYLRLTFIARTNSTSYLQLAKDATTAPVPVYWLQRRAAFGVGNWADLIGPIGDTNTVVPYVDASAINAQNFYRVRVGE